MAARSRWVAATAVAIVGALTASVAWAVDTAPPLVDTFGGPGTGDGQLDFPEGIDHDGAGNRFVTDLVNERVVVFDADGDWVRTIGSVGTGPGQFDTPSDLDLFVDETSGQERLIVADSGNHRLQVLEPDGTHLQTVTDIVGATPTDIMLPLGIEYVPSGPTGGATIFVADSGNDRILQLESDFTLVREIEGSTLGAFLNVQGLAVSPDGSTLFAAERGRNAVVTFDVATGTPLGSFGNTGTGGERLSGPTGLAIDPLGFVYVGSTNDDTVVKFRPDGGYVWSFVAAVPTHADVDDRGRIAVSIGSLDQVRVYDLCPIDFSDVPADHAFAFPICWMAATGVSTGYGDGTYRPVDLVSRQAMAAFLYRLAGEPAFTPPATSPFSDVSTSSPFYGEITWAVDEGITTGYPGGTFKPTAGVSRQAMAAFLYRLAGEPAFTPPGTASFTDVPTSHPFFAQVEWMASLGIAGGYADGTFKPTALVSRQAMSAFMGRYAANG